VEVAPGGAALGRLAGVDLSGLTPALAQARIVVACDVDNPLTGPTGAAAVYGPQKGATPDDVRVLDAALTRWADAVAAASATDARHAPGAGAAGGVGFAALAMLGATLRPGIELVLELLRFDELLRGADLVITGEGSLDAQSLSGKAPIGVARAAQRLGVPVVVVCGRCVLSRHDVAAAGIRQVYALSDIEPDQARSMRAAAALLEGAGVSIARTLPIP
jgi:glycerate kinase